MRPRQVVEEFDSFLAQQGLSMEATVIGGAALALLDAIDRETRDVDILDPLLHPEIEAAARSFARASRDRGLFLGDDWLNNGPSSLGGLLPEGWRERLRPAYSGSALRLQTLGRADLLKTKLFALCDRGTDLTDCLALAPTRAEVLGALDWVVDQDGNELWPDHVRRTFDDLCRRLGHGVH